MLYLTYANIQDYCAYFCVFSLQFQWNNMIYTFLYYFCVLSTTILNVFLGRNRKHNKYLRFLCSQNSNLWDRKFPEFQIIGKKSIWWHPCFWECTILLISKILKVWLCNYMFLFLLALRWLLMISCAQKSQYIHSNWVQVHFKLHV